MTKKDQPFSYAIDHRSSWPPKLRPQPPYGPTSVEILRSCALRGCFQASPGYEQRIGYSARIGNAFHRTIESITTDPPQTEDPELIAQKARSRYQQQLRLQNEESDRRPREKGLPRDSQRAMLAEEAVVAEALRLVVSGGRVHSSPKAQDANNVIPRINSGNIHRSETKRSETEVRVTSKDGLFAGRIDRIEYDRGHCILVDYKSALRNDVPERYIRQILMYASMWNDTNGFWPDEGVIHYPLLAKQFQVSITPEECIDVINESKELIEKLARSKTTHGLASPGEVCTVCDYRPWCEDFWLWQDEEAGLSAALEKGAVGVQGVISQIDLVNLYWNLNFQWRNAIVSLRAPRERIPHLSEVKAGQRVRVLDTKLRGLRHSPKAAVTDYTEVFLISS